MPVDLARPVAALRAWRPALRPLTLAFIASVFFTLACNGPFLAAMHAHAAMARPWLFVAATGVLVTAIHFILFALLVNRWTAKPLLSLLILITAAAVYFMRKYGIYMDVAMLRNVLGTDAAESRELLAWDMLPHLFLYAVLPLLFLWRVQVVRAPLRGNWYVRPLAMLLALLVGFGAVASVSKQLVPLMREHKELRYLITPGNYIYSLLRIAGGSSKAAVGPRTVVGADAKHIDMPAHKPTLLVIVIGETVRAANWGLNGYARQTTPQLAALDVINFPDVSSCGTNTETSLPCMFSPYGRKHYDEDAIRNSESLLHVLTHAGMRVIWRDNQSGCKGVCEGLPVDVLSTAKIPGLCDAERCLDEVLLQGLAEEISATPGDLVIVLHQLGNHGPAYFQRYPEQFRRFTPTCDTTDLGGCSKESVVNTYDNAVLYTDHFLARTIALLKTQARTHDTALVYVSDHGESLGENGLYLHSLPYAIAPDTQTHVPMVMWFSPAYAKAEKLDVACLRGVADQPASHDNLFHTALGIMDVKTQVRDAALDLVAGCRSRP